MEAFVAMLLAAAAQLQGGPSAGTDVLVSYVPILMMFVAAAGLACILVLISRLIGQRRPTKEKLMPYECGKDPVGSARERHSVRFYIVAMIFLLFDIEARRRAPTGKRDASRQYRANCHKRNTA